jgi:hypothetical protein
MHVVITFRASRNENSIFDSLYVKVLFTPKSYPFLDMLTDHLF